MKSISLFRAAFATLLALFLINGTVYAGGDVAGEFYSGLKLETQDSLDIEYSRISMLVRSSTEKLPSRYDLSSRMPPVGGQGKQGSCTAWATTYYTKSYHEMIKNRWQYNWGYFNPFVSQRYPDPKTGVHIFTPAWTYNQINGGVDNGSSISEAFKLIVENGALPWVYMPYDHSDYRTQPTQDMKNLAYSKYRAKSYALVDCKNLENVKREIASGNPVVGAFKVTSNWYNPPVHVRDGGVFDDHTGNVTGGHAMAVVGYDDDKVSPSGHRGAFRIINSWGTNWGNNGYFWVSYKCFTMLCQYAFVLYDSEGGSAVVPDNSSEKKISPPPYISASKGAYSDKIYVSWGAVENAVSYIVERSIGNSGSFSRVAMVNTGAFIDTNIQPGYRYNYRIITVSDTGRSEAGLSPVAEGYAVQSSTGIPVQITDLKVLSAGKTVSLDWSNVPGAQFYSVYRYDQNSRSWVFMVRVNSSEFIDRSPFSDRPNYYYVSAVNSSGTGKMSNVVSAVVAADVSIPGRVYGLRATYGVYSDRVEVSWKREPAAKFYILYRWNPNTRKWDFNIKTNSTSYIDRDSVLTGGQVFTYTVKAFNDAGSSPEWSVYASGLATGRNNAFSFVKSGFGGGAPSGFVSFVNERERKVTLKWESENSTEKFKIYRKKEGEEFFKEIASGTGTGSDYSEDFPGEDGDIFFYCVTYVSNGVESERSGIVSATIEEKQPVVMTSYVRDEGLKNFRGVWRASYLGSDNKAVEMEIIITDQGNRFSAKMVYNGETKTVSGEYASKSRYLETGELSFRILPEFENDVADVEISAGVFGKSRIILPFARENQDR